MHTADWTANALGLRLRSLSSVELPCFLSFFFSAFGPLCLCWCCFCFWTSQSILFTEKHNLLNWCRWSGRTEISKEEDAGSYDIIQCCYMCCYMYMWYKEKWENRNKLCKIFWAKNIKTKIVSLNSVHVKQSTSSFVWDNAEVQYLHCANTPPSLHTYVCCDMLCIDTGKVEYFPSSLTCMLFSVTTEQFLNLFKVVARSPFPKHFMPNTPFNNHTELAPPNPTQYTHIRKQKLTKKS